MGDGFVCVGESRWGFADKLTFSVEVLSLLMLRCTAGVTGVSGLTAVFVDMRTVGDGSCFAIDRCPLS